MNALEDMKKSDLKISVNLTLKKLDREFLRLCIQPHFGEIKYLYMDILLEFAQRGCIFTRVNAPIPCYYLSYRKDCVASIEVLTALNYKLEFLLDILKETK